MKILFLSRWYPHPPDNGSKIRILNLLRALCERHSVTLISFVDPEENVSTEGFPSPGPVEIQVCPYTEFRPNSRRAILGFLSRQPRWLVDTYSPKMELLIRRAMVETKFDLIVASQTSMASYYHCFDGTPAIFEEVELGCFRPYRSRKCPMLEQARARLRWAKHRRFVAGLLPNFSFCTVASELESRMLAEIAPGYPFIHVIPNSIDLSRYERLAEEKIHGSLIFTGSLRYNANLDAMDWFLKDIYPMIQSRGDDVSLTITGDPGCGKLPDASNVVQTGRVEDVREWVSAAMVSIAPIRMGGGTRFKILESFALRTPVVATSKAVEGIEAKNGEHLLLADAPEDFARSVLRLLDNPAEAYQMADKAFDLVRARYDWRTLSQKFLHLVDQAVHNFCNP